MVFICGGIFCWMVYRLIVNALVAVVNVIVATIRQLAESVGQWHLLQVIVHVSD
jgi:hypothetical protein